MGPLIPKSHSQSCNDLAVMRKGQCIFHGSPRALITSARGHVWNIELENGERLLGDLNIVSTIQMQNSTVYRVVGQPDNLVYRPVPVEPSLEDGYMWLIRQAENC